MKRSAPSSSSTTAAHSSGNVDNADLAAFQNDLKRVRAAVRQRDDLDSPDIKSPDEFKTVLEAFNYLRELAQNSPLLASRRAANGAPLPPVVWRHHLYALFSNRTKVDTELISLCDSNQLRILSVATSTRNADIIIQIDDLGKYFTAQKKNLLIELFISKMVKRYSKTKYTVAELNEAGFGEPAIEKFMQLGLLTNTDSSLSQRQLSFPGLGVFVRHLHQGRKVLLALIRKAKYSQMQQSDLLKRPIPKCSQGNSVLGIELHLYDIYGAQLVALERLCTDVLIRVIDG